MATETPVYALPLTGAESEVLRQLFLNGPTWDGDIISKSGRDNLFTYGLAKRENGWSFLTARGVQVSLAATLDRAKERRERERDQRARRPLEVIRTSDDRFAVGYSNTGEGGGFDLLADITGQLAALLKVPA